jgi:fucose permease
MAQQGTSATETINRDRLFLGICCALIPTAFSFVLVSNILGQLKTEFVLTNAHVGYIGGAALWGMALSLLVFGPFLEKVGLKQATVGAFIGHLLGVTLFLVAFPFAGDPVAFWILFMGAIGMGVGNGLIEVAGNPLTAALYPKNTTTKLNHFHAFFPGGMVFGGLLGWFMVQTGTLGPVNIGHWTIQIAIVYIPILVYGALVLPEKFPKTRHAEAGIPIREMFRYTLTHPIFWGLVVLKMITLSLELGPMRWIPEVLQAAGVHGMLVFVWITGLMMVLRIFAGPFVERFSPTGMLLGASVLTGIGLLMFSFFATGLFVLMVSATIFACGVAFFFPTMVGYVSEQLPRTGSLGIVVFIGLGFLAAGSSQPLMGEIADRYLPDALPEAETVAILEAVEDRYPGYLAQAQAVSDDPAQLAQLGFRPADVEAVIRYAQEALTFYRTDGVLHGNSTGNTLRAMQDAGVEQEAELTAAAYAILRPADNYGGRMAFRWIAPIAFLVALVFLVMFLREKQRGGYRVVQLTDHPEGTVDAREAFHEGPGGA